MSTGGRQPPSNKSGSKSGNSKKSNSGELQQGSSEPDEEAYGNVLGRSRVENDLKSGTRVSHRQSSGRDAQMRPGPHASHAGSLGHEVSNVPGSGIEFLEEQDSHSQDRSASRARPAVPGSSGSHKAPQPRSSGSSSGKSSGALEMKKRGPSRDVARQVQQPGRPDIGRLKDIPTATQRTRSREPGEKPPSFPSSRSMSPAELDGGRRSDESLYKAEKPQYLGKDFEKGKPRRPRRYTEEELDALNKTYIGPSTPPSPLQVKKMSLAIPAPTHPTPMPTDITDGMIAELKDYRQILTHAFRSAAYFGSQNGWLAKARSPENSHLPLPPEEGTLDYNMPRNFANNALREIYQFELVTEYDAYISSRRHIEGNHLKHLAEDDAQANDTVPMDRERYPDWASAELDGFIEWVMQRPYGKMRKGSDEIMRHKGCSEKDAQRIWREQQIKHRDKAMGAFPLLGSLGDSGSSATHPATHPA